MAFTVTGFGRTYQLITAERDKVNHAVLEHLAMTANNKRRVIKVGWEFFGALKGTVIALKTVLITRSKSNYFAVTDLALERTSSFKITPFSGIRHDPDQDGGFTEDEWTHVMAQAYKFYMLVRGFAHFQWD